MNNFSAWHWLVVGVVLYFLLRPLLRSTRGQGGTPRASEQPSKVDTSSSKHQWEWKEEYEFEVVGESHYQREIAQLAGSHGSEPANAGCLAELVPDDANPHDSKAIAVNIGGRLVGYLSRDDARSFRRRLSQRGLTGQITTCKALIVGGWTDKSGERAHYGVQLDMKPFE